MYVSGAAIPTGGSRADNKRAMLLILKKGRLDYEKKL